MYGWSISNINVTQRSAISVLATFSCLSLTCSLHATDDQNMATLNTSSNGPSITKSYQSIVNAPAPSGAAAKSPSYGQWAVFSVSAPLVNAFQQDSGGKESVLKVQSTGGT